MATISIQNLGMQYENRRMSQRLNDRYSVNEQVVVLEDINLEFEKGEFVTILGPSGCGKSTLLSCLAGFVAPTSGQVFLNGNRVTKPSSENIFLFQHNGLLPWMTVKENVALGVRQLPQTEEKEQQVQEFINMVELDGFEHHYPYQLSGGMKRRAELARALVVNPEVLIMDEPFTGLDFLTHMKMREEVVNMHKFLGQTIVMVTHFIDDAMIMGDRIVVIGERPGQVRLDQKLDFPHPRNLEKDPVLSDLRDEVYLMLGVSYVA